MKNAITRHRQKTSKLSQVDSDENANSELLSPESYWTKASDSRLKWLVRDKWTSGCEGDRVYPCFHQHRWDCALIWLVELIRDFILIPQLNSRLVLKLCKFCAQCFYAAVIQHNCSIKGRDIKLVVHYWIEQWEEKVKLDIEIQLR